MAPPICPNCGAKVSSEAKACPECGSDERTGWSEAAYAGSLDLPDPEFNYDEFVAREFGKAEPVPHRVRPIWWVVALMLALGLVLFVVRF